MAWDIDSFKAGFATGRALWNSVVKYINATNNSNTTNLQSNQLQLQNAEENEE